MVLDLGGPGFGLSQERKTEADETEKYVGEDLANTWRELGSQRLLV